MSDLLQDGTVEIMVGHVVLSLRSAGLERKWRSMQEQFEAGVIIEAPVIDHNKGGLIVDCGIRGFVPISQIVDFPRRPRDEQPRDAAQEIAENLQPFVGRTLRLKILEVNRKANRLILSEKVALYEERREKRDELGQITKVIAFSGETDGDWAASLDAVLASPVDHVSAYALIVEEGTRLARRISRGERALYRRVPAAQRFVRNLVYWSRELFVTGMLRNGNALDKVEELPPGRLIE